MLRILCNSVAALAAVSALAAPLAAQTTATPPAAPAEATPAATLPPSLTELGITDARILEGRRGGQRVEGTLPGGAAFRAMLDDQGQLRMMGTKDDAALPADILSRLVPEAVRSNAVFAEFARIEGIGRSDDAVMLSGADAQGESIRAGFSTDGTLQRFGRGDMDRPRMDRGDDRDKHHGKRDGRGERSRDDDRRGRGGDGAGQPLDDAAIQGVLRDGGYTQPGAISRDDGRVEVEAVNPEGEPVTVTINPRGVVVRELAR